MNKFEENVAVDLGYGFVKAISSSGKNVTFPAIIAGGHERQGYEEVLLGTENNNEVDTSNIHIEIDGRHYFVGDLANKNGSNPTGVFETERFNNEYAQILINVAIQLVTNSDNVNVSTGLPIGYFQAQSKGFQETLERIHPPIKWISGKDNGGNSAINIKKAFVFPQGASALFTALVDNKGNYINTDVMQPDSRIGLLDIGQKTTEYVVVQVNNNGSFPPVTKLSGTWEIGINTLHKTLLEEIGNKIETTDLSTSQIESIIKNGYLKFKGKKIDLRQEVEQSKRAVASTIKDRIERKWTGNDSYDFFSAIYISGGGGTFLEQSLQPLLDNRLELIPNSQLANAIGYMRLGLSTLNNIQEQSEQELVNDKLEKKAE